MGGRPRHLLLCTTLLGACACLPGGSSDPRACEADDECAREDRCRQGVCVSEGPDEGGPGLDAGVLPDALALADAAGEDAAGEHTGGDPGAGQDAGAGGAAADAGEPQEAGLACAGAWDGVLESAELPLVREVPLRVWSAGSEETPTALDLVGTIDAGSPRAWDFSSLQADDRAWSLVARPVVDVWYAAEFPGANARVPLDESAELWGLVSRDDEGLRLLGVASEREGDTLLRYEPPVDSLRFPLRAGDAWRSEADVRGTLAGNPFYVSRDVVEVEVVGEGRVATPAGSFPVLQVRTRTESRVVVPWFPFEQVYPRWQQAFYTACLGQVAYALGPLGDDIADFPAATELRRVGLP